MKIQFKVEVEAPDGATHFSGDLLDDPVWYKCTQVGAVGDHWWWYSKARGGWFLAGHSKPSRWLRSVEEAALFVIKK